ncbi:MAG TPA: thioredoxin family protein [Candidatus Obscuribacterales bacterium]
MHVKELISVALLLAGCSTWLLPALGQEQRASCPAADRSVSPELIVLDFFSSESEECAALKPIVTKAQRRFVSRVKVLHINVDDPQNVPFVKHVGVRDVPTLIVVNKDGEQLKKMVGAAQGGVLPILLATLLPDSPDNEAVATDGQPEQSSLPPAVLTKQEAKLDVN